MITWRSFHQTADTSVIQTIESQFEISFPKEYIQLVMKYDSGVPDKKLFEAGGKQRVFQRLISIRADKHPNISDAVQWVDQDVTRIPFALDPFGNMLCFAYSGNQIPEIVFVESENNTTYSVSQSLDAFLEALYSDR